tara:strand:+ start:2974 stop:3939 length:966 start_codon:yes stop_codon:yes gene_type:complete
MKTIISVDGGGIKGIVAATILQAIQNKLPRPIHEYVDCFAGTSTGGLITCGLTIPDKQSKAQYSTDDIVKVYQTLGPKVFSSSFWHKVKTLWGLIGPKFPLDGLEEVAEYLYGNTKLKEALTQVIITTYDLATRQPIIFDSLDPKLNKISMKDLTMGTSSVPTAFPSVKSGKYNLIDGGIFAVSPALSALAMCKKKYPDEPFLVVSIGNGDYNELLPHKKTKGWGLLQWASAAIDVVIDGICDSIDLQTRIFSTFGGGKYYRLQFKIPEELNAMDDPSKEKVADLRAKALQWVEDNDKILDDICKHLITIHLQNHLAKKNV